MTIDSCVWDEFDIFIDTCKRNRVFPECEYIEKIKAELTNVEQIIDKGTIFYRARTYKNSFRDRAMEYAKRIHDDTEHGEELLEEFSRIVEGIRLQKQAGFNGYDEKGSFVCPDPKIISAGRCNYENEQCLYVGEDIKTAISEIKPLIREDVSVACIRAEKQLKIVDFGFESSNNPIIQTIAFLFIMSPTLENYDVYTYTQIICALVKKMGYDGIRYSSCQILNKYNYAIFNFDKCRAVSSDVYTIDRIDYKFSIAGAK